MSQKRPLDAAAPEQDEAPSPTKRPRGTVLKRRARAASLEQMAQMVRQVQFDMAKLFVLLTVIVARLSSMERLLLDLPNALQRLLAEQFGAFQRSFMGSMEEKIRSVLHTEIQERPAASLPDDVHEPSRQIAEARPDTRGTSRVVKLRFVGAERPKDPLYAGCRVQWQNGKQAKRGQEDFTEEELNKHIHMCKGKQSVLTTVTLRNGEAYLGPFFFAESSYRKKLRLAARVKTQDLAVRVQEAITAPFVVKDRRSESNEKSYPPSKEEAVHRLEKISLKGKRFNDLAGKNITTVKHLMRHYHEDKSGLQKLTGMKEDWSIMIKHATTSNPGNEIYSYKVEEEHCELLFNDFYDLVGMMINGLYVPFRTDQFPQFKVNKWKMSAHKKFEELENSVGLLPDYFMSNGLPVRAVLPNSDASTSVQARMAWQCSNDIIAQQEFGERQQLLQEITVQDLSNKHAGPSRQETLPLPQYTYGQTTHQELCQLEPSVPCNEMPHYLNHGNIFDGQASFSTPSTIPSHNFASAQDDSSLTGLGLTAQNNGYLRSSTTDAPDTSYPVTGGVSVRISSVNHVQTDTFSGLSSIEEWLEQTHVAGQGFVPASYGELPSYSQFDDYEL